MKDNFDTLIQKIQDDLPDLVTPEMLVRLGLANHVGLFRIRKNGGVPFIKLSNARILYMKSDVIAWLKRSYNEGKEDCLEECARSENTPLEYIESQIETLLRWKCCVDIAINDINNRIES